MPRPRRRRRARPAALRDTQPRVRSPRRRTPRPPRRARAAGRLRAARPSWRRRRGTPRTQPRLGTPHLTSPRGVAGSCGNATPSGGKKGRLDPVLGQTIWVQSDERKREVSGLAALVAGREELALEPERQTGAAELLRRNDREQGCAELRVVGSNEMGLDAGHPSGAEVHDVRELVPNCSGRERRPRPASVAGTTRR